MKKFISLLLALLLLLSLCACGRENDSRYRTLSVVGARHYCSIFRGGDKLAPVVNAALEALAGTGTLSALCAARLGSDRSCLDGDAGALAALEALPEPRTLIFGVESDFYPMSYVENGEVKGLCADIAAAVGELLGWEVMVLCISPDEVGDQLNSGNIDCALGFDPAVVSASKFTVGDTFLESDVILAVPADSEIRRVRDLAGCRVGTISDPVILKAVRSDEKLTKYAAGATEYLSLSRCLDALEKGWCSAVVLDTLMLAFYRGE